MAEKTDPAPTPVQVENAQNVNVPGVTANATHLPYVSIIAGISVGVLGGFAFVTWWVLSSSNAQDPILVGLKGSLIQTWNNLAVMAAGFWLASSLGSKMSQSGTSPKEGPSNAP